VDRLVPLWPSLSVAAQGIIVASEPPQIPKTVASDPKAMFHAYCASCHGDDATGNGPVGVMLKTKPADLTKITARNNGTFPEVRIRRYIEGLDTIPSHGNREMPVWGPLLLELEPNSPGLIELRVTNLTNYLQSIQQ
jgi:mono/diheme cytochrome c family protein